jgi:hypothetical protein
MNFYTFFDLLALPLWIFLIIDALYSLKHDKNWRIYIRLTIGIVGFIADLIFVVFQPAKYF